MKTLAYNTSKGAVVNFTRTLAGEWGKYDINVNASAPGFFPSKMTKGTLERIGAENARRPRAAAAPGRRRRPEGRDAAVRLARPASTSPASCWRSTAACQRSSPRADARSTMKFGVEIPFVEHLGFELLRFERRRGRDRARAARPSSMNSWGVAHGGVTDDAARRGHGPRGAQPGEDGVAEHSGVVTIEMKTSFMRPGLGRLVGHGPAAAPHRVDGLLRGHRCVDAEGQLAAPTPPAPSST